MASRRPEPRMENGLFVPSAPIPLPSSGLELGRIEQLQAAMVIARNPLEVPRTDAFTLPIMQYDFLGEHQTILNDPAAIKHCFVENPKNYAMHPLRQSVLKPVTRDGLISAEGLPWKKARKTIAPMFTPRHVTSFTEMMRIAVDRDVPSAFEPELDENGSGIINISDKLTALTYRILSETLFSGDLNEDTEEVIALVAKVLAHLGRPDPFDLLGVPPMVPRLTKLRGHRDVKKLRRIISHTAEFRAAQKARGEILPQDFLTLMLEQGEGADDPLSPEEIEDHLVTFIGAGHETTARAITWLLYLLSNDQGSLTKAQTEIGNLDMENTPPNDWEQYLPWTMACFEEAMRLYPPVAVLFRKAIEDDEFGEVKIPAGSATFVNVWVLHRHKTLWKNPTAFDPDRFYGENRKKIGRFQYLPFGAGPRVCIGMRFAMKEAAILLAIMLKNYRFEYVGEKAPWPIIRLSLQPDNGMPMRVTRR